MTRSLGDQLPSSTAVSPDLSREGPFDASQSVSASGAGPLVLDNLPGCQYRMTSYDNTDMTEVDPAYGLQLHHPRFLESRLMPHLRDTDISGRTPVKVINPPYFGKPVIPR